MSVTPFLELASRAAGVKKTETTLPIAKKGAQVTPLLVGDDLSLRSSLTSPVGYDREIVGLIHNHTEIIEEDQNIQMPYDQFCREISNLDKLSLLWALYKSTYESLAKERQIQCPKQNCKKEFKIDIYLDELIHEDTYTPWDQSQPFYEYGYPISVEKNGFIYEFITKIPSIQDNNRLLSTVSIEILQKNLDQSGSVFSKPQQMVLLTKAARLTSKEDGATAETDVLEEMLVTFHGNIPFTVSEEFFEKYNEHFSKYVPNFYKQVTCPFCNHSYQYPVDLEVKEFGLLLIVISIHKLL